MDILESNVKHHSEDIRELKKRVDRHDGEISDLRTNQQVTNQSLSHVMDTLSELKNEFKTIDKKIDENQIEQLKEYKNGVWKIGVTVIGGLAVGFLFFFFGV